MNFLSQNVRFALRQLRQSPGFTVAAVLMVALRVLGSLGATRFLSSLLFGVATNDPLTFSGVIGLLALVALAACYVPARRAAKHDPLTIAGFALVLAGTALGANYLPARRAAKVDPMVALRYE